MDFGSKSVVSEFACNGLDVKSYCRNLQAMEFGSKVSPLKLKVKEFAGKCERHGICK